MAVNVLIPTPLRKLTNEQDRVSVEATNVAGLISQLGAQFPGLTQRLLDESGQLRRFVNVYVNDNDIRFLGGVETALNEGDQVSIVPAIAGG